MEKRIDACCAEFSITAISELFREFGHWLDEESGSHKAAITINKYRVFIATVEQEWAAVPTYQVLLKRHGTPGLRRWELPMRFLTSTSRVTIDSVAKADDSAQRQISAMLLRFPSDSLLHLLIAKYYDHLQKRFQSGKASLRSIRLALTPAVGLLLETQIEGNRIPRQENLDSYLERVPGQRAAISGFVGFLKRTDIVTLELPAKPGVESKSKKRLKATLEHELNALLQTGGTGGMHARKLIGTALAHFHGLPKLSVGKIQGVVPATSPEHGDVTLLIDGARYSLPLRFDESARMFS